MKNLITLLFIVFGISLNAQTHQHKCTHNHAPGVMCGVFEPDSTQLITIRSLHTNEPVEVLATMKDGQAFIEGGILVKDFTKPETRGITCDVCGVWENSTVVYEIDPNAGYPAAMVDLIEQAIENINTSTNLQIVQRTTESNYVKIINGSGCYSSMGYQGGGAQNLSLKYPGCNNIATIMHEIFHASGIFHEQSREDRDSHVIINTANISNANLSNFNQYNAYASDHGEYDKGSVMHYGPYAFSSNGEPTITNLDGTTTGIGNSTGELSQGDIDAINFHYPSAPLPVKFVSIDAKMDNNNAIISWSTAAEYNNSGFTLQKSTDGREYTDVDFVRASEISTTIKEYQAIDYNVESGKTYYRIEQEDIDGTLSYSDVVYVENQSNDAVYPTKTRNFVRINTQTNGFITATKTGGTSIKLPVEHGKIDMTHVSSGLYIIELNSGETHKVVKL